MKYNASCITRSSLIGRSKEYFFLLAFLLFTSINSFSQDFPKIPEQVLLQKLQPPAGKLSVVIDTDTYNEIDDQFAVVYALYSADQLDVQAIYAAPFFNDRSSGAGDGMSKSYDEILTLLEKMGREPGGFVFRGSESFLESRDKPLQSDAARDLVKKAMAAEETLYVLTLGAPTNVASAILMEPEIIKKIVVVWLGGKGLDWRTASEFNLYQDLLSSQVLFDSGVPLIQLPTNPVTSHLLTTVPEVETYLKGQGAIGDYLFEIFKAYHDDHFAWSKVIWDISAIAYAINPGWFSTEIRHSPILTDQVTYSFDHTRHFYRVATALDRDGIFGDMFRKIRENNKGATHRNGGKR
jgi:purine nucleosidase